MKAFIEKHCVGWSEQKADLAEQFRLALRAGNTHQNLTRLIEPEDFFWGHLWDVYQLQQKNWLGDTAMDLGSGCGVPGLLEALLSGRQWHLVESEKRKAEFLRETALQFGLSRVAVSADRVEKVLPKSRTEAIVARAVGPISRIWSWIGNCSTWNTLILFKGPSWESEWEAFQAEYPLARVALEDRHEYTSQSRGENRSRILLRLRRVES